jgi:thiamine-monophosphate kinase
MRKPQFNSNDRVSTESTLIQTLFAPLALGNASSYGLRDDVAYMAPSPEGLVVTQDHVIEGTHFLASDPVGMVARRLVRRNLSDLIAKGVEPSAAFLSLAWPKSRDHGEMAQFATGLGEDMAQLCGNCPLLGGDTSTIDGPLVASLTMMGRAATQNGQPILRSGAQTGDIIATTGTIGDAWLGLQVRLGLLGGEGLAQCVETAMAPKPPPLALAPVIAKFANASLDVSDGLIADAGHMADCSQLRLSLDLAAVPLSSEACNWLAQASNPLEVMIRLATGGDDYQCLVAISPDQFTNYVVAAKAIGVTITKIGTCEVGAGVRLNYKGQEIPLPEKLGWSI